MELGSERGGAHAEFGSPEPVENVRVRIKRSVLEEMAGAVQRALARSTPYT